MAVLFRWYFARKWLLQGRWRASILTTACTICPVKRRSRHLAVPDQMPTSQDQFVCFFRAVNDAADIFGQPGHNSGARGSVYTRSNGSDLDHVIAKSEGILSRAGRLDGWSRGESYTSSLAPLLIEPDHEGAERERDLILLADKADLSKPELTEALKRFFDKNSSQF
jgi:hypothetical protein